MERRPGWWKEAVVYQIYPRSFQDSNNDGIGDLAGITSRLDDIASLGVDAIWLNPFFQSPNDDGGYDISDYYRIQPEFGTMEDFDLLLKEAHQRGLHIIIDLVFNHSSDEHEWFKKSRCSKDNPYRDFYFWRPGKKEGLPPSNWPSFFGGNAWEKDDLTGEYYLHLFSKKQPDLNWENPEVRRSIRQIISFWTEKGVDGIRLDVISAISKRTDFPDADTVDFNQVIARYYANGPRLPDYIRELREESFSDKSILTVGEGPGITPENAMDYLVPGHGLDMIFHFGHMFLDQGAGGRFDPVPWHLQDFRDVFLRWDKALSAGGWGSIFLGNHDFARQVSRWGDDGANWNASAKALLTLLLTLRGTPFIFAGDEIGMTNLKLTSVSQSRDVETLNGYQTACSNGLSEQEFLKRANRTGRDNARSPYQWTSSHGAGFTTGQPWMTINPNHVSINRDQQEKDSSSILNHFRRMVRLRKMEKALVYGDFNVLETRERPMFAYERRYQGQWWRILINFSALPQPAGDLLDGFTAVEDNLRADIMLHSLLQPWQAVVLKR